MLELDHTGLQKQIHSCIALQIKVLNPEVMVSSRRQAYWLRSHLVIGYHQGRI